MNTTAWAVGASQLMILVVSLTKVLGVMERQSLWMWSGKYTRATILFNIVNRCKYRTKLVVFCTIAVENRVVIPGFGTGSVILELVPGTWFRLQITIVCCRRRVGTDVSRQHRVCCLWGVVRNPSVQHRHVQSTRRSHYRRWNERSTWHRRLPSWSSTVRRRLAGLHLASVSWWSLVREVADESVYDRHFPGGQAVGDVTSPARDVTS